MIELDTLLWVWLIAGGIALLVHVHDLPRDADWKSVLLLVVAWPWWLSHYSNVSRRNDRREDRLAPVRVEVVHRKRRKR